MFQTKVIAAALACAFMLPGCEDCCGQSIGEHVITLPEDGGKWHLSIAGEPSDVAEIKHDLLRNRRLNSLVRQTRLHEFDPSDPMYKARFEPVFGGVLPKLWLQNADGRVVYKQTGGAIQRGEQLADTIAAAISDCRPGPRPGPDPRPRPGPYGPDGEIPDIGPDPNDSQPGGGRLLYLIAGAILVLLGLGAGVVSELRKE